jgi:hypothetical protein
MNKFHTSLTFGVATAFFSVILSQPVDADTLPIFNTGVNSSGLVLSTPGAQDTHWLIGGSPSLTAVDPYSGWMANQSSGPVQSGWIGSSLGAPGTTYTYIQNFFIPAGATNFFLDGQWAVDDEGALFLNDYEILDARYVPSPGGNAYMQFKSFSLDDPTKLIPGSTNTLKAVIVDYGFPHGFQAQFYGSYTPVPGPLPAFGVAAAFAYTRRLRQRIIGK